MRLYAYYLQFMLYGLAHIRCEDVLAAMNPGELLPNPLLKAKDAFVNETRTLLYSGKYNRSLEKSTKSALPSMTSDPKLILDVIQAVFPHGSFETSRSLGFEKLAQIPDAQKAISETFELDLRLCQSQGKEPLPNLNAVPVVPIPSLEPSFEVADYAHQDAGKENTQGLLTDQATTGHAEEPNSVVTSQIQTDDTKCMNGNQPLKSSSNAIRLTVQGKKRKPFVPRKAIRKNGGLNSKGIMPDVAFKQNTRKIQQFLHDSFASTLNNLASPEPSEHATDKVNDTNQTRKGISGSSISTSNSSDLSDLSDEGSISDIDNLGDGVRSKARRLRAKPGNVFESSDSLGLSLLFNSDSDESNPSGFFENPEKLASFAPAKDYVIEPSVLENLTASTMIGSPEVFKYMKFTSRKKARVFFKSKQGLQFVKNMVNHDGLETCNVMEHFGKFFRYLPPEAFELISPKAVVYVEHNYFRVLRQSQVNRMLQGMFGNLLADQVSRMRAAVFQTIPKGHIEALSQTASGLSWDSPYAACAGCAGLRGHQLASMPDSHISLLSEKCLLLVAVEELSKLPAHKFQHLNNAYFGLLTASMFAGKPAAIRENFAKNMTPKQMAAIRSNFASENDHPFFGLQVLWSEIGGSRHAEVIKSMGPQTFNVLARETIESMDQDGVRRLSMDTKRQIQDKVFKHIPVSSLSKKVLGELAVLNTPLCRHFNADMFSSDLLNDLELIPSFCFGLMKSLVISRMIELAPKLPEPFFADIPEDCLDDFAWLPSNSEKFTIGNWRHLRANQCERLEQDKFNGMSTAGRAKFLRGITANCFGTLPFFNQLKSEDLKLIPKITLQALSIQFQSLLADSKVSSSIDSAVCSNLGPTELSRITQYELSKLFQIPNCLGSIPADVIREVDWSRLPKLPPNLLSSATHETMANLPEHVYDRLEPIHWKALKDPSICRGIRPTMGQSLKVDLLPAQCTEHLSPIFFTMVTARKLNGLPLEVLRSRLCKAQIAALPAASLAAFEWFQELGINFNPGSPDHPCLGVDLWRANALPTDKLALFMRQCSLVIEGQRLLQANHMASQS